MKIVIPMYEVTLVGGCGKELRFEKKFDDDADALICAFEVAYRNQMKVRGIVYEGRTIDPGQIMSLTAGSTKGR